MEGTNQELVSIDLRHPRYSQKSFVGRVRHFLDVTDPRTLFVSSRRRDEARALLAEFNARTASSTSPASSASAAASSSSTTTSASTSTSESEGPLPLVSVEEAEQLWAAKKIVDASVHPNTGEVIPLPFRFSAFVPANVLICAGMLAPNPSAGATLFWQWLNQSYNIAVNHANRNASNAMSVSQISQAYVGAVVASCSIAVGLGKLVTRLSIATPAIKRVQMFVPYTAVASAGVLNVLLMRRNEMTEGIIVQDHERRDVGRSRTAGQRAIMQVSVSRVLLPLPALTLPPMIMKALHRTAVMQRTPWLHVPAQLCVIAAILVGVLPLAIAVFPQECEVNASSLEPHFHSLTDSHGVPITKLYYNKGL